MKQYGNIWKYAAGAIALVVLAVLVMDFNNRTADLHRLQADQKDVQARVTAAVETQSYLQTQIVFATSEPAVANWAYEQGHMVRPGDNPVVPVAGAGRTPTPTPAPVVTPVKTSPWQAWLALFFGP
jgi:hypothetical protein